MNAEGTKSVIGGIDFYFWIIFNLAVDFFVIFGTNIKFAIENTGSIKWAKMWLIAISGGNIKFALFKC